MLKTPSLPAGFVLETPSEGPPPLPSGFVLNAPQNSAPPAVDFSGLQGKSRDEILGFTRGLSQEQKASLTPNQTQELQSLIAGSTQKHIDDNLAPKGSLGGKIAAINNGLTSGAGEEVASVVQSGAAGLASIPRAIRERSFAPILKNADAARRNSLAINRTLLDDEREANPLGALALEVVPSLLSPATAAKTAGSVGQAILRGGATAAGQGAAFTAADARGGAASRAKAGLKGGLTSGVIGSALPGGAPIVNRILNKTKIPKGIANDIKKQATDLYSSAREQGATVKPEVFEELVDGIGKEVAGNGLSQSRTPATRGLLAEIDALAQNKATDPLLEKFGKNAERDVDFSDIQSIRKQFSDVGFKDSELDGALAARASKRIGDFAENITPEQLSGGGVEGFQSLKEANRLFSQSKKLADIDTLQEIGTNRASGEALGTRNEFRTLLNKATKSGGKGYTADEIKAIKRIANGTPLSQAAKFASNFAPNFQTGTGVIGAAAAGGAALANPVLGLGLAGAGLAGQPLNRLLAKRDVDKLRKVILDQGKKQKPKKDSLDALQSISNRTGIPVAVLQSRILQEN